MTATTRLQELIGSIREGETVNVMVAMERNHQRQKIPATAHQMLEDIKALVEQNLLDGDKVQEGQMVASTEFLEVLERYFGVEDVQRTCPVCKQSTRSLKRHLKDEHGWRYTPESPHMPVPVQGSEARDE